MNKLYYFLCLCIMLNYTTGCIQKSKETEITYKELIHYSIGEDYNKSKDSSLIRYRSVYLTTADLDGDGVRENISIKVAPVFFFASIPEYAVDSVPAIILINKQFSRIKLNYNYLPDKYLVK